MPKRTSEALTDDEDGDLFGDDTLRRQLAADFDTPAAPVPDAGGDSQKEQFMQVYLRMRPFTAAEIQAGEDQNCMEMESADSLLLRPPADSHAYRNGAIGGRQQHRFTFSHIYDASTSQQEFFDGALLSTVREFIAGQNCLVFTYGITNSGKTYTIQGEPSDGGVLPRTLDVLFNSIEGRQRSDMSLKPCLFCGVMKLSVRQEQSERQLKESVLAMADSSSSSGGGDEYTSAVDQHSSAEQETSDVNCSVVDSSRLSKNTINSTMSDDSIMQQSCVINPGNEDVLDELFTSAADRVRESTAVDVESQGRIRFSVWVSFAEIYNECVYDLLVPPLDGANGKKRAVVASTVRRPTLQLRDDRNGSPYIKGLREIHATSADEAYKILTIGKKNLQFACTRLNQNSSRSHCIFTLKVLRFYDKEDPRYARVSMLSFCDLAGAERYSKTQSTGSRLKEAGNINTSLLTLGRCMVSLRHNQVNRAHPRIVPFRESKLTRLFQSFLCGKGRAAMIVNVNKCASSFDETLHALKYSAIAKQVLIVQEPVKKLYRSSTLAPTPGRPNVRHTIGWATPGTLLQLKKEEEAAIALPLPEEDDEDWEESVVEDDEENDGKVKMLTRMVESLKRDLEAEQRQQLTLEIRIREEVCQEMAQQLVEIENVYSEQMRFGQARAEEMADKRIELLTKALTKEPKRRKLSDDDASVDDGEDADDGVQQLKEQIEKLESDNAALRLQLTSGPTSLQLMELKAENAKLQAEVNRLGEKEEELTAMAESMGALQQLVDESTTAMQSVEKKLELRDEQLKALQLSAEADLAAATERVTKAEQMAKLRADEVQRLRSEQRSTGSELEQSLQAANEALRESEIRSAEATTRADRLAERLKSAEHDCDDYMLRVNEQAELIGTLEEERDSRKRAGEVAEKEREKELASLEERHAAALEAARKESATKMANVEQSHVTAMDAERKRHESALREAEKLHAFVSEEARSQHQVALEEAEKRHLAAMAETQQQQQHQMASLDEDVEKRHREALQSAERALDEANLQHRATLEEQHARHKAAATEAERRLAGMRVTLEMAEETEADLREMLAAAQRDAEKCKKEAEDARAEMMAERDKQNGVGGEGERKGDSTEKIADLERALREADERTASAEHAHQMGVRQLRREKQQTQRLLEQTEAALTEATEKLEEMEFRSHETSANADTQVEEAARKAANLTSAMQEMEACLRSSKASEAKSCEQVAEYRQRLRQVQARLDDVEAEKDALEAKINEGGEVDALKSELAAAKNELEKMSELKSQLAALNCELEKASGLKQELATSKDELKVVEQLQKELTLKKETIEKLSKIREEATGTDGNVDESGLNEELVMLKTQLAGMDELKEDLRLSKEKLKEMTALEEQLALSTVQLEKMPPLERELSSLKKELQKMDELKAELASSHEQVAALKADVTKMASMEQELASSRADLQKASGASQEEQVKSLKTQVKSLSDELASSSADVKTRTVELASSMTELSSLRDELASCKAKLQSLTEEQALAKVELKSRKDELVSSKAELEKMAMLQEEVASSKTGLVAMATLREELNTCKAELTKMADLNGELSSSKEELEKMRAKLEGLVKMEEELVSAREEAARLKAQNEELSASGEETSTLRSEMETLRTEMAASAAELQRRQVMDRDHEREVAALKQEVEHLGVQVTRGSECETRLRGQLQSAGDRQREQNALFVDIQGQLSVAREDSQRLCTDVERAKAESARLRDELDAAVSSRDELESLRQQLASVRDDAQKKDEKLKSRNTCLSELMTKLDAERNQLKLAHKDITANEKLVQQLKTALQEQEATMETQDTVLRSHEDEIATLKKEVEQLQTDSSAQARMYACQTDTARREAEQQLRDTQRRLQESELEAARVTAALKAAQEAQAAQQAAHAAQVAQQAAQADKCEQEKSNAARIKAANDSKQLDLLRLKFKALEETNAKLESERREAEAQRNKLEAAKRDAESANRDAEMANRDAASELLRLREQAAAMERKKDMELAKWREERDKLVGGLEQILQQKDVRIAQLTAQCDYARQQEDERSAQQRTLSKAMRARDEIISDLKAQNRTLQEHLPLQPAAAAADVQPVIKLETLEEEPTRRRTRGQQQQRKKRRSSGISDQALSAVRKAKRTSRLARVDENHDPLNTPNIMDEKMVPLGSSTPSTRSRHRSERNALNNSTNLEDGSSSEFTSPVRQQQDKPPAAPRGSSVKKQRRLRNTTAEQLSEPIPALAASLVEEPKPISPHVIVKRQLRTRRK